MGCLRSLVRRKQFDSSNGKAETHHHHQQLAKALTFPHLIAIGVGSTIGAGVYILVGTVAREHSGPALALSFLIAGISAALSAFCYAELSSRFPSAGSAYHYSYICIGEGVAWLIGWALILEYTIGGSTVARGISPNLAMIFGGEDCLPTILARHQIPGLDIVVDPCAAVLVFIVTGLCCLGVKESTFAQGIVTTANVFVMIFVIVAGSYLCFKTGWVGYELPTGYFPYGVDGMLTGSATVFFAYIGFDTVASMAEEVKNPRRDLPLGIGISLLLCCLLYMMVSVVIVGLVPYYAMDPDTPISSAFSSHGIQWAAYLINLGAVMALCSALMQPKEMENLYMDVLYTIKYKVGADTELSAHRDQLYVYAQKAFDVTPEQHRRYMAIVHEEKPPIVVLHVTVVEAEGLEAKDANGFSDPYCMLGIQPGMVSPQPGAGLPPSPANSPSPYQPPLSPRPAHATARTLSEGGIDLPDGRHDHHDKLRKHHSFRLSFKRKERGGGSGGSVYGCREHRDSISAVPARFIQATSVRRETLNPKWGENFMFDIDDVTSDILHLDIWDHDDESSVLDAVSKLNEVRGVKGLGRFFKQIAQSARSGSQDDFLGCINIPIQDVPSTGLDKWYQLEARSQRSNIQGNIRLKLWLSTREDHGQASTQNNFDNWTDVRRNERLLTIFADYEMSLTKSSLWNGELCHEATSILHQHAVQSGVSELQLAVIRWLAFSHIPSIDPQFLLKQLSQLEAAWGEQTLTVEEEDWLADSFNVFLDYSMQLIRKYRKLFPPYHHISMNRLEYILRCLSRLSLSKAYGKCCPFNKDIRGEIGNALRLGTNEWYEENRKFMASGQHDPETRLKGFVRLVTSVLIDLQKGVEHYNVLFENINGVFYYAAIYKQHEKLLAKGFSNHLDIIIELSNDLSQEIAPICKKVKGADFGMDTPLSPTNSETGESLFELYLAVQEFIRYREHLNASDYQGLSTQCYYHWFEPALEKWLDLAKLKIVQRAKKALELSMICQGEMIVKHSTSSNDLVTALCHMKEFWKHLAWPDLIQSYNFVLKLLDAMCEAVLFYAQLVHQRLKDSGFYDDVSAFKTSDEVCAALNDLEYVWRTVAAMPDDLHLETVVSAVEATGEATADQCRADVTSLLDPVFNQYGTYSMLIVGRIAVRMQAPLKKCIFHLAWSPDTLPTTDAIIPLQEYLDSHLISLNTNLIPKNFHKVLNGVWEVTVYELGHQMDGGSGDTKMSGFYERLYEALELLVEFFHAEGNGLPPEILTGNVYRAVKQRLKLHKTDTDTLIELYYEDRLMEQQRVKEANYGVLSVRAYYHHDSLCVEVLKARDVIPLDPNGFSDPFVIVELLPKSMFPYTAEQYTDVKKKTLNPLFDECFEFAVSMDQCRHESAMILFTVMDHDVITSNDFAGESFLSLNSIPGVLAPLPHDINAIDRVDLILMHQQNKGHPILHTLDARHEDKVAQDFVKKQRVRTTNS